MNKLPVATRAQILLMLTGGASMRSVSRLADVSINTVSKLLIKAGEFCARYHDVHVRNVKAKRVQVDEVWSLTAAKRKNADAMKKPIASGIVEAMAAENQRRKRGLYKMNGENISN